MVLCVILPKGGPNLGRKKMMFLRRRRSRQVYKKIFEFDVVPNILAHIFFRI